MSGKTKADQHPHLGFAVLSAGVMALGLAGGLQFLGLVGRLDKTIASMISPKGMSAPPLALDPLALWLSAAALAFSLPAVIVNVPGSWRRLVVWGGTIALTFAWGPVMILAAYKPQIGVALVSVLWSGFCAMFYTKNHILPVDKPSTAPKKSNHGSR